MIVDDFIQSLLSEERGGWYCMSQSGNSQLIDPPRELFIPKYRCDSLLNVHESSEVGFCLSTKELFFSLDSYHIDRIAWVPVIVCDNHNAVAHAWGIALDHGLLKRWVTCIHIDEHSDLWENKSLPVGFLNQSSIDWWKYAHSYCNVGNYIQPLIHHGYIGDFIRVEWEGDLERIQNPSKFWSGYILNIDLDYWSEDLSYIPWSQSIPLVRSLFHQAGLITIATSPSFIPFSRAYKALEELLRW